MSQQTSPFVETKYGWDFGESGWNSGMDENLVKMGFLFDGNVDAIVGTLPAPVNGQAYFLTTDNRFYFAVGSTFYSSPCPKNFIFKIRSSGDFYQFNGTTSIQVDNPQQIDTKLGILDTLGTAAFEDVGFFATQAELDIVESQAQSYTDAQISSRATERFTTKASFTASADDGTNARVMEGFLAPGDGGANLFIKDADDSVSPNDGVRSISATSGRWKSLIYTEGMELKIPTGFTFTPLVKILKTSRGGYTVDTDIRTLMPAVTGTTYYVDIVTGNNANAGTAVSPLKSIQTALNKPDVGIIKVAPGFYTHNNNWASAHPLDNRNFIVERWEGVRQGPVINSTAVDDLTWTVNDTYSNVYQAARSAADTVRDYSRRSAGGQHYLYRKMSSLAEVAALRGSWYTDGTTVYINTLEGGIPHREIKVFLETAGAFYNSTGAVLIDGIEFHGGREPFYPANTTPTGGLLLAKNCKFFYGQNASVGNGVRLEGIAESYFQNCEASYNRRDGFNYHIGITVIPKVMEINCKGFYNGQEGSGVNNGSTMHDAGWIIRVGGEFAFNEGPQVVDVNGSQSLNFGVIAHDSRLGLDTIANAGFYTSDGPMYLYDCESYGCKYDCVQTGAGQVYVSRTIVRDAVGSPQYYDQKFGDILA